MVCALRYTLLQIYNSLIYLPLYYTNPCNALLGESLFLI